MSAMLPEGISEDDEVKILWERGPKGVKVKASLGGVQIVVKTKYGSEQTLPWLAASLPTILETAWAEIASQETP